MIKVIVLTNMYPSPDKPGFGVFVEEQFEQLSRFADVKVELFDTSRYSNVFTRYVLSFIPFLFSLLKFKPNVIHVHFGLTFITLFPLYPIIKLLRIKIVTTFHGGDIINSRSKDNLSHKLVRAFSILVSKLSDLNLAVSKDIMSVLPKGGRNVYLPCGVSHSFYESDIDSNRERIIVFPSNPARKEKNYKRFCRIVEKSLVSKTGFKVAILDKMNRRQVKELFFKAHCLLLTSDHEGSPQSVKEALVCDLPVLSTDVGDVKFLIKDVPNCTVASSEVDLIAALESICKHDLSLHQTPESKKASFHENEVAKRLRFEYLNLFGMG